MLWVLIRSASGRAITTKAKSQGTAFPTCVCSLKKPKLSEYSASVTLCSWFGPFATAACHNYVGVSYHLRYKDMAKKSAVVVESCSGLNRTFFSHFTFLFPSVLP